MPDDGRKPRRSRKARSNIFNMTESNFPDLIVANQVVVEIKSCLRMEDVFTA
jgi:hypothetical protein